MEYEDDSRRGDGQAVSPLGIGHSISPGVPCPELVLVGAMTDGSYVLVAHPQCTPTAFVAPGNAGPLHRALETAFGNPTGSQGSSSSACERCTS
ncbi:MAG: hypothetical protein ACRDRI_02530 [Pseudonocardiaceae bacterium]